jgi:anti-sigma factor RsiW
MARQNDHNRAEELISAYLDKQVSAEEREFFERHIASCANCRAQLEATRSMIVALRAMPAVKAPRSFVLPRELAKQPRRSVLSLYPALRLATVVAALAFVVLFAGDLLINQSGGSNAPQSVPAAAPAPLAMQAPAAPRAAMPNGACSG